VTQLVVDQTKASPLDQKNQVNLLSKVAARADSFELNLEHSGQISPLPELATKDPVSRATASAPTKEFSTSNETLKAELASGTVPDILKETLRLVPFETESSTVLQEVLGPLALQIQSTPSWRELLATLDPSIRDFSPQEIKVILSDEPGANAFHLSYSRPAVVGFTREMIRGLTPEQVIYVLTHELVHSAVDRLVGSNRKNSKLEEGLAYGVPLAVMHDLGVNPEGIEEFVTSLLGRSSKVSLLEKIIDPHPTLESTLLIVETTLTFLRAGRGSLDDPDTITLVSLPDIDLRVRIGGDKEHISCLATAKALLSGWDSRPIDEKLNQLTAYISTMTDVWAVRCQDLKEEFAQLKGAVSEPLDAKALNGLADAILDRAVISPSIWGPLYHALKPIASIASGTTTVELGYIKVLCDSARDVITACKSKDPETLTGSVKRFVEIARSEPLAAIPDGRQLLRQIAKISFKFPDKYEQKDKTTKVSWNPLVVLSRSEPAALEAAILLGLMADQRVLAMHLDQAISNIHTADSSPEKALQAAYELNDLAIANEPREREVRLSESVIRKGRVLSTEGGPSERRKLCNDASKQMTAGLVSKLQGSDLPDRAELFLKIASVQKLPLAYLLEVDEKDRLRVVLNERQLILLDLLVAFPEDVATLNFDLLKVRECQRELLQALPGILQGGPNASQSVQRFFTTLLSEQESGGVMWNIFSPVPIEQPFRAILLDRPEPWVTTSIALYALEKTLHGLRDELDAKSILMEELTLSATSVEDQKIHQIVRHLARLRASPVLASHSILSPCESWRDWMHRARNESALSEEMISQGLPKDSAEWLARTATIMLGHELSSSQGWKGSAAVELYEICRSHPLFDSKRSQLVPAEILTRRALTPLADTIDKAVSQGSLQAAAGLLNALDNTKVLSRDKLLLCGDTLIKRVRAIDNPNDVQYVTTKLLGCSLREYPERRIELLEKWAASVAQQVGKERDSNDSEAFREKVMSHITQFKKELGHTYLRSALVLLAEKIEVQDLLADQFERLTPALSEKDSIKACLGGMVAEGSLEVLRHDNEVRKSLFRYLRYADSDGHTRAVVLAITESSSADKVLEFLVPREVGEQDTETADLLHEIREMKDDKRDELSAEARLLLEQMTTALERIHQNFRMAPLEFQALVLRELMIGGTIDHAGRDTIIEETVNDTFKGEDTRAVETRAWLHALLAALKPYERPAYAAALLSAHQDQSTEAGLGAALARFAETLSPLAVKVCQSASGDPDVDEDLRTHFERLTYRVSEVPRWEYIGWIRGLEGALIRSFKEIAADEGRDVPDDLRIIGPGRLLGSGSVNATVEIFLSNGERYALSMIRPYSEERADRDADVFEEALNTRAGTSRAAATLKELLRSANDRMKLEVDGLLAIPQGAAFQEMYRDTRVELPHRTVQLSAPRVVAAGGRFYLTELVEGEHLAEMSGPESEALLDDVAVATLAVAFSDIVAGRFDADRHIGNRKVEGDTIHELDPKGLSLRTWSAEGYAQLTRIFFGIAASGMVNDVGSFLESFLAQEKLIRAERGAIDPLIPEVKKAVVSLRKYLARVDPPQLQAVLYSGLWSEPCQACRDGVVLALKQEFNAHQSALAAAVRFFGIDVDGLTSELQTLFTESKSLIEAFDRSGLAGIFDFKVSNPTVKVVRGGG
jgi:hypothetical protein